MSLTPAEWHARYTEQARWTLDLRRYLLGQVTLPPHARVLEVGCGTGAVMADLQIPSPLSPLPAGEGEKLRPSTSGGGAGGEEKLHPSPFGGGQGEGIFGIDLSQLSLLLAQQHAPAASLACADAHHLPFANGSFDLVLAHFLLLWVQEPLRVLTEMRRVARRGGAVMALAEPDYGGRVDYPAALAQIGAWQTASLQAQGADPFTGRKLAGLFAHAGLADVQVGVLGGQWHTQIYDPAAIESEWQVIEADLQALPGEFIPPAEALRLRRLDEESRQQGERVLFVPTFYAWGKAR